MSVQGSNLDLTPIWISLKTASITIVITFILGLLAAVFLYNGVLFWTLGFGVCHILYGLIMYRKYDLKKK